MEENNLVQHTGSVRNDCSVTAGDLNRTGVESVLFQPVIRCMLSNLFLSRPISDI